MYDANQCAQLEQGIFVEIWLYWLSLHLEVSEQLSDLILF